MKRSFKCWIAEVQGIDRPNVMHGPGLDPDLDTSEDILRTTGETRVWGAREQQDKRSVT